MPKSLHYSAEKWGGHGPPGPPGCVDPDDDALMDIVRWYHSICYQRDSDNKKGHLSKYYNYIRYIVKL